MCRLRGLAFRGLLAILVAWSLVPISAQVPRALPEHEVKAAYLYQFGRYVEWPSDQERTGGSFAICVLGKDPFGGALDEIVRGKSIASQPVATRRIGGTDESQACRILFVSASEGDHLPAILKAMEGKTVLTVGEGPEFTHRGGMVAFVLSDNRVRFAVNLAAAEAANLKLSSQLLKLATSVDR